jgi:hypothetical protein
LAKHRHLVTKKIRFNHEALKKKKEKRKKWQDAS